MRFKLVEDILVETSTFLGEIDHLLADLSDNTYRPQSVRSMLTKAEISELKEKLDIYLSSPRGRRIDATSDEIIDSWEFHHINGVHKTGKSNSTSREMALVNCHKQITDDYRAYVELAMDKLPSIIDPQIKSADNIGKLILRLIAACKGSGKSVSSILRISTKDYSAFISGIPAKLSELFDKKYRGHKQVIPLDELNLTW